VPDANLARYLEYVKRGELPLYESSPGLVAVWLLERSFVAYTEVMVLSVWRNEKFMMVFVEKQPSPDEVKRVYGVTPIESRAYGLTTSLDGKLRSDFQASE
jgi:hypothetical protein